MAAPEQEEGGVIRVRDPRLDGQALEARVLEGVRARSWGGADEALLLSRRFDPRSGGFPAEGTPSDEVRYARDLLERSSHISPDLPIRSHRRSWLGRLIELLKRLTLRVRWHTDAGLHQQNEFNWAARVLIQHLLERQQALEAIVAGQGESVQQGGQRPRSP
ncbi:MAG: hypothetical protein HYV08_03710 [Deltaproteobacteria bacterium]|nr:hypothetical protein [Deltaproteobacteria bacterium]